MKMWYSFICQSHQSHFKQYRVLTLLSKSKNNRLNTKIQKKRVNLLFQLSRDAKYLKTCFPLITAIPDISIIHDTNIYCYNWYSAAREYNSMPYHKESNFNYFRVIQINILEFAFSCKKHTYLSIGILSMLNLNTQLQQRLHPNYLQLGIDQKSINCKVNAVCLSFQIAKQKKAIILINYQSMSNIQGRTMHCPFDPNHVMPYDRFLNHLQKCKFPDKHSYLKCRFNPYHVIHQTLMPAHEAKCQDRAKFETILDQDDDDWGMEPEKPQKSTVSTQVTAKLQQSKGNRGSKKEEKKQEIKGGMLESQDFDTYDFKRSG